MTNTEQNTDNPLLNAINRILTENPGRSFSEYELIACLVKQGNVKTDYASDKLSMYTVHFLTMNALYSLQEYYREDGKSLTVSALKIQLNLMAQSEAEQQALSADKDAQLNDFYLDWKNLESATQESVQTLLDSFWQRFVSTDEHDKALAVLELSVPVTLDEIKQQYRRKAMLHHPDRGGDATVIAELNSAMEVLQSYYA